MSAADAGDDRYAELTQAELAEAFKASEAAGTKTESLAILERLISACDGAPTLRLARARYLHDRLDRRAEGLAEAEALSAAFPNPAPLYNFLALACLQAGHLDRAEAYAEALLATDPTSGVAYSILAQLAPERALELAPALEELVSDENAAVERLPFYWNALGRIRDRAGAVDDAWAAFTAAKQFRRTDPKFASLEASIIEAAKIATPAFLEARAEFGSPDSRPCFIVGLPRSGSTLIERALAAHPSAFALGERHDIGALNLAIRNARTVRAGEGLFAHLTDLTADGARVAAERYLASTAGSAPDDALRVIDKMPGNFAHLGFIALLFPNARIIHTVRDPLDVFLSCYKELFEEPLPHSEDQMVFAHYYILYQELMQHWRAVLGDRLIDVVYEDLVADFEPQIRRVVDHVGLPWDPACAEPHRAEGHVATASAAQVRKPVNAKSVGRWRRYAKHLAPLREVVERYDGIRREIDDELATALAVAG